MKTENNRTIVAKQIIVTECEQQKEEAGASILGKERQHPEGSGSRD